MSGIRAKYDEDFKKKAVRLSYASPKVIAQVARDLGVNESMLYRRSLLAQLAIHRNP